MSHDDDVVLTDQESRQAALDAQVDQLLRPDFVMDSHRDVKRMYAEIRRTFSENRDGDIFVYRVKKSVGRKGERAGRVAGVLIRDMPREAWGKIAMSFDGYGADPRELFEFPHIREFCQGMLLGDHGTKEVVDHQHVRQLFQALTNERECFDETGTRIVDWDRIQLCGSHWVVAVAFAQHCFVPDPKGGWLRDWGLNFNLVEALRGPEPSFGGGKTRR